ncbi:MAG TPA: hypothetical protein VF589_04345 [Allosphingosinicella sp.]|jgi:hypothetical protein
MKRLWLIATAASAASLAMSAPAAAQSWQGINQRQAMLDQRIDEGVRRGLLTQQEVATLRAEFRTLANLEADYRRSGGSLSSSEVAELDRRFDLLAQRVRFQSLNAQGQGGIDQRTINQRQADLEMRIDQGIRNRALTQQEAILLRGEFRTIANLEAEYRRSGANLSAAERADLDRRFDALARRVYQQKNDAQAGANGWRSINLRQAELDARMDQGVRNGALTQQETYMLRGEFRRLADLEAQYRSAGGGLNAQERDDLERRFDQLSRRIYVNKQDRQGAGGIWQSIDQRQSILEQRIDIGLRSGRLTQTEAVRLRSDFRLLANIEADYRRSGGGLSIDERADLDRRFDVLTARIRIESNDWQRRW